MRRYKEPTSGQPQPGSSLQAATGLGIKDSHNCKGV